MVSEAAISNMRERGFVFNDDGIPVICAGPLHGRKMSEEGPYGTYDIKMGDWEYAYRRDRSLYIQYPSDEAVARTIQYTLTFVYQLDHFPVDREDGLYIDEVINRYWLANAYWGTRPDSLRAISQPDREKLISWWKDGRVVYSLTIGEVVDLLLDPVRVQIQRDHVKAKMSAMREEVPVPLRPKEESDPPAARDDPSVVIPESKMVIAGKGVKLTIQPDDSVLAERETQTKPVEWHPRKTNGFQHVDLESDLPDGVRRLALEHSTPGKEDRIPQGHAIMRGWGENLSVVIVNGITVTFQYNTQRKWYETEVTAEQLEDIL